jgi:transposase
MKISVLQRDAQVVFVGIDAHERTYSVSVFIGGVEVFHATYPSEFKYLKRLLMRYAGMRICAVYEAGPFGYALYDSLKAAGVEVIVTPPSFVLQSSGDKVKTDKRDARKLAHQLSCGLLRAITVPDKEKREVRELLRTREQLVDARRRAFVQIQSKLRYHGLGLRLRGRISFKDLAALSALEGVSTPLRKSLGYLRIQYEQLTEQLQAIRKDLVELCEADAYRDSIRVLTSAPGVGQLTALAFLLELPSMKHFKTAEHLGSFIGLTPSEHSSGEKKRQGSITRCGNARVRTLLVEGAWRAVEGDPSMRAFYERVKRRSGGKRAIIAVARKMAGKLRVMLLRNEEYAVGTV